MFRRIIVAFVIFTLFTLFLQNQGTDLHVSPTSSTPDNNHFVNQPNGLATINVTETGLPSGWLWGIDLSEVNNSNNNGGFSPYPFKTYAELGGFPAGNYSLYAGTFVKPAIFLYAFVGNISLSGLTRITLQFHAVNMSVSGLPSNLEWGVSSISSDLSSSSYLLSTSGLYPGNSSYVDIYLPNGNASFDFSCNGNYYANPMQVTVHGRPLSLNVTFNREYRVTFTATGLGNFSGSTSFGISGIPIKNNVSIVNSSSDAYMLPNGTYSFYSYPSGKVTLSQGSSVYEVIFNASFEGKPLTGYSMGQFTVNGTSENVSIQYNLTYSLQTYPPPQNPDGNYAIIISIVSIITVGVLSALILIRRRMK